VTEPGLPADVSIDRDRMLSQLRARGFSLPADSTVEVLGGGISNVVAGVSGGDEHLVVKMPLASLRVADEWQAPVDRLLAECDALRLTARLTPAAVPAVRDCDEMEHVLVMDRAPASWWNWKELLLAGQVAPEVAARLARILASWHSGTTGRELATPCLLRTDIFVALRLDPYYRVSAGRLPELSERIMDCARRLAARPLCLIHGDFSPKNVLTGPPGQLWVVDFEVACWGDPAFDLAFFMTHLLLKSMHRPSSAADYDAALADFCAAYQGAVVRELSPDWSYVIEQTACLVIARVIGKSPAEYLTSAQQGRALAFGKALLSARPAELDGMLAVRGAVGEE
jgi:aminoglycoside phosphotransferase (APT) family kinase protein